MFFFKEVRQEQFDSVVKILIPHFPGTRIETNDKLEEDSYQISHAQCRTSAPAQTKAHKTWCDRLPGRRDRLGNDHLNQFVEFLVQIINILRRGDKRSQFCVAVGSVQVG